MIKTAHTSTLSLPLKPIHQNVQYQGLVCDRVRVEPPHVDFDRLCAQPHFLPALGARPEAGLGLAALCMEMRRSNMGWDAMVPRYLFERISRQC